MPTKIADFCEINTTTRAFSALMRQNKRGCYNIILLHYHIKDFTSRFAVLKIVFKT